MCVFAVLPVAKVTAGDCWFCLQSPQVEKHLVMRNRVTPSGTLVVEHGNNTKRSVFVCETGRQCGARLLYCARQR
jgi:hypothetical protein